MPVDDLKIGIVGGYVSGKATFLNALMKAPFFRMRSNTHNHAIIQIQAATEKKIVWRYMEENARDWKKSREDIRFSKTWKRIRVEIPGFLWGNTVFYDFPQINNVEQWVGENIRDVSQMDSLVCVLDAEYLMSETNRKTLTVLADHNLAAVVLNKCDIIDKILDLKTQLLETCPGSSPKLKTFTVSSQLELQRWTAPKERIKNFAFTESRAQAMTLCDLAFSDLRVWLYELINGYNGQITNKKEK